ncbi:MAG: hypothetical protein H6999_09355 [Hahellaceae bacterium]|nr:hypothetical protein [Hahellaceae bacterium]MCP5169949.1 hypothetical protein [Hahellaceae bacterium]
MNIFSILCFGILTNALVAGGAILITLMYEWSWAAALIMPLTGAILITAGGLIFIAHQPLRLPESYTGLVACAGALMLLFGSDFPGESALYLWQPQTAVITPLEVSRLTNARTVTLENERYLYDNIGEKTTYSKLGDATVAVTNYVLPVVDSRWQPPLPVPVFVVSNHLPITITPGQLFTKARKSDNVESAIENARQRHGLQAASDALVIAVADNSSADKVQSAIHRQALFFFAVLNGLWLLMTYASRRDIRRMNQIQAPV